MAQRVRSILLVVVMLFGSVNFVLCTHHCQGELVGLAIFQQVEACSGGQGCAGSSSDNGIHRPQCCKDSCFVNQCDLHDGQSHLTLTDLDIYEWGFIHNTKLDPLSPYGLSKTLGYRSSSPLPPDDQSSLYLTNRRLLI